MNSMMFLISHMKLDDKKAFINGVELYHMRNFKKLNGALPNQNKVPDHLGIYETAGYTTAREG